MNKSTSIVEKIFKIKENTLYLLVVDHCACLLKFEIRKTKSWLDNLAIVYHNLIIKNLIK